MDADLVGEFCCREWHKAPLTQELARSLEPRLGPAHRRPARRRPKQFEREALEHERRERIGLSQFARDAEGEQSRMPVLEARDRLHALVRLDDHEPGAVAAELILVRLYRGHRYDASVSEVGASAGKALSHRSLDHDRDAGVGVLVPGEPLSRRK